MNDELTSKLTEIINYIKNSSDYQKYVLINEQLKENQELTKLIADIKRLQQQAVKYESLKDLSKVATIDLHINEKLKRLETYPIYIEYIALQEDLNVLLQSIKTILDKYFYDITN